MAQPYFLSDEQIKYYYNNGYVPPMDLIPQDLAFRLGKRLLELNKEPDIDLRWNDLKLNLIVPWIDQLTRRTRLLDAVESLLGPDIITFGVRTFVKPAGSDQHFGAHQDLFCWHFIEPLVLTAWIPLTDIGEEDGPMTMYKGSHIKGLINHKLTFEESNRTMRGQSVDCSVNQWEGDTLYMKAGQFSLHHAGVVHSSPPNTSHSDRVAIAIRFAAANIRFRPGTSPRSTMLVRGELCTPHFTPERRPSGHLVDSDREYRNKLIEPRLKARVRVIDELAREQGTTWPPQEAQQATDLYKENI